eukprot:8223010-Pyramimonas_sp.AAC.1
MSLSLLVLILLVLLLLLLLLLIFHRPAPRPPPLPVPVAEAEHFAEKLSKAKSLVVWQADGKNGKITLKWVNRAGVPRILQAIENGQLLQMGGWPAACESEAKTWLIGQLEAYKQGKTTKPEMEIAKVAWLESKGVTVKPRGKAANPKKRPAAAADSGPARKRPASAEGAPKKRPGKKASDDDDDDHCAADEDDEDAEEEEDVEDDADEDSQNEADGDADNEVDEDADNVEEEDEDADTEDAKGKKGKAGDPMRRPAGVDPAEMRKRLVEQVEAAISAAEREASETKIEEDEPPKEVTADKKDGTDAKVITRFQKTEKNADLGKPQNAATESFTSSRPTAPPPAALSPPAPSPRAAPAAERREVPRLPPIPTDAWDI